MKELHSSTHFVTEKRKTVSVEFEQAEFNIHGLKIAIYGPATLVRNLREDLKFFDITRAVARNITELFDLKITLFAPDRRPSGLNSPAYDRLPLFFKTGSYKVFGQRLPRLVEYSDGSSVYVADGSPRAVRIFARSNDRSYELAYLSLHSFVGEKLERLGFIRLHALSFARDNQTAALMLPSLGGSPLTSLMNAGDYALYADDTSFLYKKTLQPYPWRLKLDNEKVAKPLALTQSYWSASGDTNQVRRPTRQEKIEFIWAVVIGTGLMQMAEYIFRTDNLVNLVRTAFRRLFWALGATRHLRVLELNDDSASALKALGDDLNQNPPALRS